MEPQRRWEAIAKRVAEEPDSDKVVEMSHELIKTLDEETKARLEHSRKSEKEQAERNSAWLPWKRATNAARLQTRFYGCLRNRK